MTYGTGNVPYGPSMRKENFLTMLADAIERFSNICLVFSFIELLKGCSGDSMQSVRKGLRSIILIYWWSFLEKSWGDQVSTSYVFCETN